MTQITDSEMKTLLKAQQGELDAVLMYNALAEKAKLPKDQVTFRQLAKEEGRHAAVFFELTKTPLKGKRTKAILLPILYTCIGRRFLYPLIARGEYNAVTTYEPVAERFPEVESVKQDEQRHGDTVMALLK